MSLSESMPLTLDEHKLERGLIYIMSPFANSNPLVRGARVRAAALLAQIVCNWYKQTTHLPLSLTSDLSEDQEMAFWSSRSHQFWLNFDEPYILAATKAVELRLPGWRTSKGMDYERTCFIGMGIEIVVMSTQWCRNHLRDSVGLSEHSFSALWFMLNEFASESEEARDDKAKT